MQKQNEPCYCFQPDQVRYLLTLLFLHRFFRDFFASLCSSVMTPWRTNLRLHLRCEDVAFLDFVSAMLVLDPRLRPSAAQLLHHPWLRPENELPFEQYQLPA